MLQAWLLKKMTLKFKRNAIWPTFSLAENVKGSLEAVCNGLWYFCLSCLSYIVVQREEEGHPSDLYMGWAYFCKNGIE